MQNDEWDWYDPDDNEDEDDTEDVEVNIDELTKLQRIGHSAQKLTKEAIANIFAYTLRKALQIAREDNDSSNEDNEIVEEDADSEEQVDPRDDPLEYDYVGLMKREELHKLSRGWGGFGWQEQEEEDDDETRDEDEGWS